MTEPDIVTLLDRWLAWYAEYRRAPVNDAAMVERARDEIVRLQQAIESVRRDTLVRLHHEEANKFRAEARDEALDQAIQACEGVQELGDSPKVAYSNLMIEVCVDRLRALKHSNT